MTNVFPRQAAILLGGMDARPGAVAGDAPGPLASVGGRPFLAWLLRELCRFGVEEAVLLAPPLGDRAREGLAGLGAHLPKPMTTHILAAPVGAGTGGALHCARDRLDARFILCRGESWLDADLAGQLAAFAADPPDSAGRTILRGGPDGGRVASGIHLLTRAVLDHVRPGCSLEHDVLPALAAEGRLRGAPAEGGFIDAGSADGLARARRALPRALLRPALFLDRDGTINLDHGWVGSRDRFDWIDGARAAIAAATRAGYHVFVVTNQAGIARGLYTAADVAALHGWMCGEIRAAGGTIDDIRIAPHHPEHGPPAPPEMADWRKPGPGMIRDLAARWEVDMPNSLLVGDRDTDIAAAAAAGIPGHLFPGGDLAAFVRPRLARGAGSWTAE